jgi:hypothetical protein
MMRTRGAKTSRVILLPGRGAYSPDGRRNDSLEKLLGKRWATIANHQQTFHMEPEEYRS